MPRCSMIDKEYYSVQKKWEACYRHFRLSCWFPAPEGEPTVVGRREKQLDQGWGLCCPYLLLSPFIFYLLLLITDPTPAPPLQGRGTEVRWQREKQLLGVCQTVYTNKKWRSEQVVSFIFNDEAGKKECCCGTSFD